MSIYLNKLARKFTSILTKKANNPLEDPLLKNSPGLGKRIEPEMTEDIDNLVQDSLNLVILLERSWLDFQKKSIEDGNEMGTKMANNVLLDLEDIEEALTNPTLLNYDLQLEYGLIDVIDQNASMISSVLEMTKDKGLVAPEFKKLDQRVYKWINELIANCDKIHDLAMSQSSYAESVIADKPKRMIELDKRNIDEISEEELHPDFKSRIFQFEDPEYSGDFDEPYDPLYEKNKHGYRPRIRPNPTYKDDAEHHPILNPEYSGDFDEPYDSKSHI